MFLILKILQIGKRIDGKTSSQTVSQGDDQHENHDPIYIVDQESVEIGPDSVKMEPEDSEEEVEIYPYTSDFVIIPSQENIELPAEVGKSSSLELFSNLKYGNFSTMCRVVKK